MRSRSLEEELRNDLEELQRQTLRGRQIGSDPHELEQLADTLEEEWAERIERERGAQLGGAEVTASVAVEQQERAANLADNEKTLEAISELSPEVRDRIWNATGCKIERSQLSPQTREEQENVILEPAQLVIEKKFDKMRQGMEKSVDAIREGREPDLSFVLSEREAKRQAMFAQMAELDREAERENERSY